MRARVSRLRMNEKSRFFPRGASVWNLNTCVIQSRVVFEFASIRAEFFDNFVFGYFFRLTTASICASKLEIRVTSKMTCGSNLQPNELQNQAALLYSTSFVATFGDKNYNNHKEP